MLTQAAVLRGTHREWVIEDIVVDPPRAGEVMVQLTASGLCHTDEHVVTGDMFMPPAMAEETGWELFPMVGGHEGAGVVVEVGPEVSSVKPGDHVVLSFVPACGRCPSCSHGQQNLCDRGAFAMAGRQISDMTSRHHSMSGEDLAIMCCLGTFAPYTVVNEASCVRIDDDIPLDKAALVGCGVTTGWGSAVYVAEVQAGETVVVVGAGGIGINAVQGAAMAGARHIVALDPIDFKRTAAMTFGATHTASDLEETQSLIGEITWGRMADKAIIANSLLDGSMIAPVMGLVGKGGRCVVAAMASLTQIDTSLSLTDLALMQKQLVGSIYGGANPRRDINRLLRLYMEGKLNLDDLVTTRYPLELINQGYEDLRAGMNLRGMIIY